MSIFDIISSIAYILVGVMAPYEAGFYLSRGNTTTCKIQGFLIQLGQTTSMFYNLFLSIYFFLVIICSWRERQFKKLHVWVHMLALAVGFGMAGGSVPFIQPQFGVCGILPPLTASQWQVSLFYTGPVSIVLVVLTVVTACICRKVYVQRQKMRRWLMNQRLSITKAVFWQSFWYVTAFYVTLPFVLVSFYVKIDSDQYFWILVATAILAPLQGLMNALVYFQRSKGVRAFFGRVRCLCSWEGGNKKHASLDDSARTSSNFWSKSSRRDLTTTERLAVNGLSDDEAVEDRQLFNELSGYLEDAEDAQEQHQQSHDPLASPAAGNAQTRNEQAPDRRHDRTRERLSRILDEKPSQRWQFRRWVRWRGLFKRGNDRESDRQRTQEEIAGILEYWHLHEEESDSNQVFLSSDVGRFG